MRVLDIVVELETLDPEVMRPGMVAKLKIIVDHFKDVLAVPLPLIQIEGETSFVWVMSESGPVKREITVGKDNGVVAVVDSGLKAGDQVGNPAAESNP